MQNIWSVTPHRGCNVQVENHCLGGPRWVHHSHLTSGWGSSGASHTPSQPESGQGSISPPSSFHLLTLPQTEHPHPWPSVSSDIHSLWNVSHSSSLRSQMTSSLQPPLSAQVQPHPLLIGTGSIQDLSCGDYDYRVKLHMFCRIVLISLIIWTLSAPFHIGSGGRPDTSCVNAL